MANGGSIRYSVGFDVQQTELNRLKATLQEIQRMSSKDFARLNFDTKDAEGDLARVKKSAQELQDALKKSTNVDLGTVNLAKFNKELKKLDLQSIYKNLSLAGNTGTAAFRNLTTGILQTNVQIKQSNKLLDDMARTMKNTVKWGAASSIMNTFTNSVQQAYGYIKHLDSSLNDIRIVTGYSADEMDRFAEKANKAAKNLAASTTDYTEASLIYYQQGLSGDEVEKRAETTLKTANVTGQSAQEVSEQLTAVWNGYKVSAAETEVYVDKLAAVAASTAADLEELSTGMSKVASAASTAGVDIDQLNATLATVVSVTRQAPESVGTAFKTIYARLGDLAVDGVDEFGTSLGQISSKMKQMGIDILDETGDMRDMGEVVEEVAAKWETWTSAQKQAAAVAMAGKRQYNNLIALFENWDMYESALATSQNSLGTLSEQQEIYLDSAEAKLQQLKTAQEGLYDSLLDADTIKEVAGLLTGLVSGLEHVVDSIGGGGTVLLGLGAAFTKVFNKQLTSSLTTTAMNFKTISQNAEKLKNSAETVRYVKTELEKVGDVADKATVEIVNMYGELLKTSGVLSQDDMQEFETVIQNLNEAANAADRYAEAKNRAGSIKAQAYDEGINTEEWTKIEDRAVELQNDGFTPKEMLQKGVNPEYDRQKEQLEEVKNTINDTTQKFQAQRKELEKITAEMKTSGEATLEMHEKVELIREDLTSAARHLAEHGLIDGTDEQAELEKLIKKVDALGDEVTEESSKIEAELIQAFQNASAQIQQDIQTIDRTLDQAASGYGAAIKQNIKTATAATKEQADKIDMTQTMQGLTNVLGAVEMGVFGVTAAWNGISALWNEDLPVAQRLGQAFTGVLTGATMLIPAIIQLGQAYKANTIAELKELAVSKGKIAVDKAQAGITTLATIAKKLHTAAIEGNTIATIKNTIATKLNTAALLKNPYVLAAVAIIGVTAAIIGLTKAYKNNKTEIERAQEATEAARKEFEETQNEVNEINTALSEWSSAVDTLHGLEKGTAAWKQQLIEANNQVLTLLDTYPQLANYITTDEDGLMTISPEGLDMIQEENIKKLEAAQAQYSTAQGHEARVQQDTVATELASTMNVGDAVAQKILDYGLENGNAFLGASKEELMAEHNFSSAYADQIIKYSDEIASALAQSSAYATEAEMHTDTVLDSVMSSVDGYDKLSTEEQKLARDHLKDAGWNERFEVNYQNRTDQTDDKIRNDYQKQVNATEWRENDDGNIEYKIDGVWTAIDDTTARLELASKDTEKSFGSLTSNAIEAAQALASLKGELLNKNDVAVGKREAMSENEADAISKGTKVDGINLTQLSDTELGNLRMGTGGKTENNYQFSDEQVEAAGFEATEQGYKDYVNWLNEQANKELERRKQEFTSNTKLASDDLNESYGGKGYGKVSKSDFEDAGFTPEDMNNWDAISGYIDENTIATQGWVTALKEAKQIKDEIDADAEFDATTEAKATEYESKYDIDAEAYQNMADYLYDYADSLEGVGEEIEGNVEASQELAKEMLRYDKAAESAKENAEDWMKALNGTIQDQADVVPELADAYGNLLDIDGSQLSKDFLTNTDNLKLMQEALNGSEAAYNELQDAAQLDMEQQQFAIKPYIDQDAFYADKAAFEAQLDAINFDDMKIGAKIDDTQAIAAMERMVNSAQMTAAQAQEYLASMGVDAEVEEVEVNSEDDHQYTGATAQVTEEKVTGNDPITGSEVEYNFPSVKYKKTPPVKGKNKKKTSATALKVTAAKKSSGGGFKYKNSSHGSGNKKGSGGGGGGGGGSTPKKTHKTSTKKKDRYREVNNSLKELGTELDRLAERQEKLFGKDLLNNLNKQLDVMKKQVEVTREKLAIAQAEAKEMRTQRLANQEPGVYNDLLDFGIKFDKNGEITNYDAVVNKWDNEVKRLTDKWNSMSAAAQEADKDKENGISAQLERAEKNRDTLLQLIGDYDELLYDTIPGLMDEITKLAYDMITIQIEKFNIEVGLRLDISEAVQRWAEFEREVLKGLDNDDLLEWGQSVAKEMTDFVNTNVIETATSDLNQKLAWANEVRNGSVDNISVDNAYAARDKDGKLMTDALGNVIFDEKAMMEDLIESEETLMENVGQLRDYLDDLQDTYYSSIDAIGEAIDEQADAFERVNDVLNHTISMLEMIKGEAIYADKAEVYDQMFANNLQALEAARRAENLYKKEYEAAIARGADEEEIKMWEERWLEAQDNVRDSAEQTVEILTERFSNAVLQAIDDMDKALTDGRGIDSVQLEWEMNLADEDQYLDAVNKAFAIQDLNNKINQSINETTSLTAQKRLNDLRDKELKKLREKDKLTQYDVDRANALYEIELKKIALEEAQKNKSQMRLRRDASGNYSYQFVADQDSITQAQNELAEAQNNLYNMDKEQFRNKQEEMLDIYIEFQEYMQDYSELSLEEQEARADEYQRTCQQYADRIKAISGDAVLAQQNLAESTYDAVASSFENMAEAEHRIMAEQLVPDFSDAVTAMMNKIHGEEGFDAAFDTAMDNIIASSGKLAEGIAEVEKVLGVEEGGLGSITSSYYLDSTQGAKEFAKAQQENIDNAIKEKDVLLGVYDAALKVAEGYLDIESAASKAARASNEFIQQEYKEDADEIGNEKRGAETASQTSTPAPAAAATPKTSAPAKPSLSVGSSVQVKAGQKWYANSYGGGKSGTARSGTIKYVNTSGSHPYNIDGLGWIKKSSIVGYDTGGYTGSWNDRSGRLALLHQKELVLNERDTKNILTAVEAIRDISAPNSGSSIASILASISKWTESISNMLAGRSNALSQYSSSISEAIGASMLNMNTDNSGDNSTSIEIHADFPAATSTYEIEAAFNSLINNASQYTHSTRR